LSKGFIEIQNLQKVFSTPTGQFVALQDIDLQLDKGQFVTVVGKSGSGKSTFMNMLTGIDRPTSGKVLVNDIDIHALEESKMAEWRGINLGIVFQFYQLLPVMNLYENVKLPMQIAQRYSLKEQNERTMELLELVGLAEYAFKRPNRVSGGQQQSAAIARALANDPPIMMADEPTGNLGAEEASAVIRIFEKLAQQGKTIVMITHDDELAAHGERTIRLKDGLVVEDRMKPKKRNGKRNWFSFSKRDQNGKK